MDRARVSLSFSLSLSYLSKQRHWYRQEGKEEQGQGAQDEGEDEEG